jgi:hypothetical protein
VHRAAREGREKGIVRGIRPDLLTEAVIVMARQLYPAQPARRFERALPPRCTVPEFAPIRVGGRGPMRGFVRRRRRATAAGLALAAAALAATAGSADVACVVPHTSAVVGSAAPAEAANTPAGCAHSH